MAVEEIVKERDDLTEVDAFETEEEVDGRFKDLKAFFEDDDEEAEETEESVEEPVEEETEEPVEEETEEPVEEETEEPVEEEAPMTPQEKLAKYFTQDEMNQLYGSARIQNRELAQKVEQLQYLTGGMNIDQIVEHMAAQAAKQYEDDYALPPDEAQRIVEDRTVRGYLEQNLRELHQQQLYTANLAAYQNEKARFLKNPLVKRYEADIDAVSQGGQRLGFEAAMKYVLGDKAYAGEIQRSVKDSTQQKAIKNASKRPHITPEGVGAGGAATQSIPPDLRRLASAFGNDPNSVAKEFQRIQRERQ